MKHLEPYVEEQFPKLLRSTDKLWQPADLLPDFAGDGGFDELRALRQEAAALPDDVLNVLVGDMITEEALPTYASWLASLEGVGEMGAPGTPWAMWNRAWCAEENRHGDALSRYLMLSGRVHMREVEVAIHHLIYDGMEIKTGADPYRFFVYTSFQELATLRSHRNVGELAGKAGAKNLEKMSSLIAGDEGWHARAYRLFVEKFLELDRDEAMLAIADMMRSQIIMPAMNLREQGADRGETFKLFEIVAQRLGVYTGLDYVEILEFLIDKWQLSELTDLSPAAAKAQDFVCGLPARYRRMLERRRADLDVPTHFRWMV
jgi:acyl-[acyl-carrier-protein] desaturase